MQEKKASFNSEMQYTRRYFFGFRDYLLETFSMVDEDSEHEYAVKKTKMNTFSVSRNVS